ncbi:MAG: T9SS type A sorting domain-containing protein [Bacteroidia bacterium]
MKVKIYFTLFIMMICMAAHGQAVNWQWTRNSACSQANGYATAMNSASDAAGNLYVVGYFADTALSFGNQILSCQNNFVGTDTGYIFIVKYDPTGNVLWTKKANGPGNSTLNGMWFPIGINTDSFGNVFVCGVFTNGDISFDTDTAHQLGFLTSFIVKFDSLGNTLWVRTGGDYWASINEVNLATDSIGNTFIVGDFTGDSIMFGSNVIHSIWGTTDIFLVKYDPAGNVIWAKGIGDNFEDYCTSVSTDPAGNINITGFFLSQMLIIGTDTLFNNSQIPDASFIAKFDTFGNAIWAKRADNDTDPSFAGVSTHISNVAYTAGQIFTDSMVFGSVAIQASGSGNHFYILKIDSLGNGLWGKGFENGYVISIKTDLLNNIYLTGTMYDSIAFDSIILPYPGSGTTPPIFIAKFDSSGNALWAKTLPVGAQLTNISCGLDQNVYLSGCYFVNNYPIGNDTLILSGVSEVFIGKLDTGVTATCNAHFMIYPDTIPQNWIVLNQATGNPPINYLWDWGDGNTSTGPTPSHIYTTPGYYNICISISDASGCTSTYCDSSTYIYRGSADNAIISIDVVLPGTTSISEQTVDKNFIIISPNPSTGNFTITFPEIINQAAIKIYNLLGDNIFEEFTFNESKKEITLTNIPSGVYFVSVFDGEKSYCKKIIVQHD